MKCECANCREHQRELNNRFIVIRCVCDKCGHQWYPSDTTDHHSQCIYCKDSNVTRITQHYGEWVEGHRFPKRTFWGLLKGGLR